MPRLTLIVEDTPDGGIAMRCESPPPIPDEGPSSAMLLVMGILLGFEENGLAELSEKVDAKFALNPETVD